ncbi:hypothetical protein DMUE_3827 [Dictyocoela muelleri]|nr:hypothetical protein DMUE_3827 [Dictyocoela muelleri]
MNILQILGIFAYFSYNQGMNNSNRVDDFKIKTPDNSLEHSDTNHCETVKSDSISSENLPLERKVKNLSKNLSLLNRRTFPNYYFESFDTLKYYSMLSNNENPHNYKSQDNFINDKTCMPELNKRASSFPNCDKNISLNRKESHFSVIYPEEQGIVNLTKNAGSKNTINNEKSGIFTKPLEIGIMNIPTNENSPISQNSADNLSIIKQHLLNIDTNSDNKYDLPKFLELKPLMIKNFDEDLHYLRIICLKIKQIVDKKKEIWAKCPKIDTKSMISSYYDLRNSDKNLDNEIIMIKQYCKILNFSEQFRNYFWFLKRIGDSSDFLVFENQNNYKIYKRISSIIESLKKYLDLENFISENYGEKIIEIFTLPLINKLFYLSEIEIIAKKMQRFVNKRNNLCFNCVEKLDSGIRCRCGYVYHVECLKEKIIEDFNFKCVCGEFVL